MCLCLYSDELCPGNPLAASTNRKCWLLYAGQRTPKFLNLLPWKRSLLVSSTCWNSWTPWTIASKCCSQRPPNTSRVPLQAISTSTMARCQDGNVLAGDVALFAGEEGHAQWACGRVHLHAQCYGQAPIWQTVESAFALCLLET